jgi:hypothetical protein
MAQPSTTNRLRLGLLLAALFLGAPAQAQFYETIRSGRPGQSIGATCVGKGIFQTQGGVDHFGYENSEQATKANGLLSNIGLRYGLTEYFEVGGFTEYRSEEVETNGTTSLRYGISNLTVGMRFQIAEAKGLAPSVGFQFRLRLPVANQYYRIDNVAPSFVFVTSQQWSGFTLITNWGGSWNGSSAIPSGNYTVNLSYAFTERFGLFLENYGTVTAGNFETRFDGGVAWLVTNNLQLDLLGGFGNNHGLNDYFVSTGFSWRTSR